RAGVAIGDQDGHKGRDVTVDAEGDVPALLNVVVVDLGGDSRLVVTFRAGISGFVVLFSWFVSRRSLFSLVDVALRRGVVVSAGGFRCRCTGWFRIVTAAASGQQGRADYTGRADDRRAS